MKWIVFQSIDSKVAPVNYSASIKIAYLLNQKVVSVGLDSGFYFFIESTTKLPIIKKIEHLLEINKDEPHTCKILLESKESIKLYNKIKSKSSKHIVLISKIKTTIELAYKEFQEDYIKYIDNKYNQTQLKELIDNEIFYFYKSNSDKSNTATNKSDLETDVLQLNLDDSENGNPLFFISNSSGEGTVMDVNFLDPNDKNAEDKTTFYGEASYIFPFLNALSSAELISTRKDLEKTTQEFRDKIDEWATICYTNPNTNLGLEYFRKVLQPYLQKSKEEILENPFMKNVSSVTHKNLESQIIIGEAPIEKIWKLYLDSETISQEVYDNLMKIKSEDYPEFEGRWPIVFFKLTENAEKFLKDETINDGVKSVRKSISLD